MSGLLIFHLTLLTGRAFPWTRTRASTSRTARLVGCAAF